MSDKKILDQEKLDRKNWESGIAKIIGRKIFVMRKRKKISRLELALRVGVCQQQIYKYEMGQNRITVDRLSKIANALNSQLINFLSEEEKVKNVLRDEMIETIKQNLNHLEKYEKD